METMRPLWKWLAWISVICGLTAYAVGWIALFVKATFWGIPNEFWFYDAIASFMLGVFFLVYAVHSVKRK